MGHEGRLWNPGVRDVPQLGQSLIDETVKVLLTVLLDGG